MNELNESEIKIIQKWRELGRWGTLELIKQNGQLLDILSTNKERMNLSSSKEGKSMV